MLGRAEGAAGRPAPFEALLGDCLPSCHHLSSGRVSHCPQKAKGMLKAQTKVSAGRGKPPTPEHTSMST